MKQTAQLFKALSDETRLRILGLLLQGELCVCDLVAILELPQSTVSRHLAYLRNSGLVSDRRREVWMHYRLSAGGGIQQNLLELLGRDLSQLAQVQEDRRRLRAYLSKKKTASCC
ncbi:MAG: ArsR/SmtB family transcription factor [Thermoleophilia bacterium]